MTIYNWEPIQASRRGPANKTAGVRIGTRTEAKKNKPRCCFTISNVIMAKMRWVCGDRITVQVDRAKGLVRITRNPDGGLTLSGRRKASRGKSETADFGFTDVSMPAVRPSREASYFTDVESLIVEWKP